MSRAISSILPRHVLGRRLPTSSAVARVALLSRRHQHTVSASEAAKDMWNRFKGTKQVREQILDENQLQKLSYTLGRRTLYNDREPYFDDALGKNIMVPNMKQDLRTIDKDLVSSHYAPVKVIAIPQGYHLVYFTPDGVEGELGPDGTDVTYNAPAPFTRRMWAGGRMRWATDEPGAQWQDILRRDTRGQDVKLVVGDWVRETTTLRSVTPKVGRNGGEMLLVEVRKDFETDRGLALVDERSWIFRPESMDASPAAEHRLRDAVITGPSTVRDLFPGEEEKGYHRRELRWSPTGLFRFSALTFNGHKIHYDPAWTAAVEGHPGCVVHGPLNLICMLDYWRDHCPTDAHPAVREVKYRALAPVYAGETYEIKAEKIGENEWEVLVRKEGRTCMMGQIIAFQGREGGRGD
ncbi:hypothetical protein F5Y08DRAFT_321678 [Xylaria arbuscula]|nr:hypothetical protein F5Y08DRAFT_321678 [Xylaria arbuscula]